MLKYSFIVFGDAGIFFIFLTAVFIVGLLLFAILFVGVGRITLLLFVLFFVLCLLLFLFVAPVADAQEYVNEESNHSHSANDAKDDETFERILVCVVDAAAKHFQCALHEMVVLVGNYLLPRTLNVHLVIHRVLKNSRLHIDCEYRAD